MTTLRISIWSLAILSFIGCNKVEKSYPDPRPPVSRLVGQTFVADDGIVESVVSVASIQPPSGYKRMIVPKGSFGEYLRSIHIKSGDHIVNLYDGREKANQGAHYCILDIDVGNRDLQQCADAVMRIRAEYFFHRKEYDSIAFNFTNGERVAFSKYAKGYRAKIDDNKVIWRKQANEDYSYENFRKYLNLIFTYAGSYSLGKELKPAASFTDINSGDVIIQGGFPGHAVLVMDVAANQKTGERVFLLAQSYMPAQEIHILVNQNHVGISPWYTTVYGSRLYTPEWTFNKTDLKRW